MRGFIWTPWLVSAAAAANKCDRIVMEKYSTTLTCKENYKRWVGLNFETAQKQTHLSLYIYIYIYCDIHISLPQASWGLRSRDPSSLVFFYLPLYFLHGACFSLVRSSSTFFSMFYIVGHVYIIHTYIYIYILIYRERL